MAPPPWLRRLSLPVVALVSLLHASEAAAQNATVNLASQKQLIRGIGGMSHAAWAGDMTAAQRTLAFGTGAGQLGFSALRIPVSDGSPGSADLATAKAARAAGAIVFATPWNSAGTMSASSFSSYVGHLNDFVTYMQGQGVDLYAISVQNEPDYGAQSGWRAWSAALCHDFVASYGAMIKTKLISCESFNYSKSYYDPLLNDAAALANVAVLGTHLYGTPVSGYSYPLADSKGGGKERWMTEHYTDSTTDANAWPNALGVATEMHHAFVEGQFSLYTWWYIVRSYGPISTNGSVSKRGWCMAHFSKLIRPGYHRVDATASPANGVYLSAYKGDSDVVIVIVNTNTSSSTVNVTVNGGSPTAFDRYTTSSSKSFATEAKVQASAGTFSLTLDGQSVTTLHAGDGASGAGGSGGGTGGTTGTGGRSGMGGSTAAGGSSGTGGRATGGGTGGVRPNDGGVDATSPGTGGVSTSTGGAATGGRGAGTGGATGGSTSGDAGGPGTGGSGAGLPDGDDTATGGCACRTAGGHDSSSLWLSWALGLWVLGRRSRRVTRESFAKRRRDRDNSSTKGRV